MANPNTAANLMLVAAALPPALAVLLALFGPLILHRATASAPNEYLRYREESNRSFMMISLCWIFSVTVGCVALLVDGVLIFKGFASLSQWQVLASVILAAADVLLPVGFLVIFLLAMRGLLKWL
jgi:hypothetical protein